MKKFRCADCKWLKTVKTVDENYMYCSKRESSWPDDYNICKEYEKEEEDEI